MGTEAEHPLLSLARAYGLETGYVDAEGLRQEACPEVLLAALRALGASIASEAGATEALRARRLEEVRRVLEPVCVHWQGEPLEIEITLPEPEGKNRLLAELRTEAAERRRFELDPTQATTLERVQVEGIFFLKRRWSFKAAPGPGVHSILLETPGRRLEATLISAPPRAYAPPEPEGRRWGLFLPLYSLHREAEGGAGDFGDLEALMAWTRDQGGHALGTLPFLSSFLDEPCDPSPYAPVSRLFWNEFYLDLEKIPELAACPEARALLGSPEWQALLKSARQARHVDYRGQMAMKRRVLEPLARAFFADPSARRTDLEAFRKDHCQAEDYARFRATEERQGTTWPQWPQRLRSGTLQPGDFAEEAQRYHLYVQWQAESQVASLAQTARDLDLRLYLDLPLGIHPQGYDAWREQELFAAGVSVGAPPDAFFARGQDWGFPPPLPERSRAQGHAYFRAALRRPLSAAGMLRIDHVMGLHRLFWIPKGFSPREGCYLRYPAEELYALLCLESHRTRCLLVGEDLGTVPPELRPAMARRGLLRCHVASFELRPDGQAPFGAAPNDSVASLNTHDMPTFAGFWEGRDLEDRQALGLMDEAAWTQETRRRRELRNALDTYFGSGEAEGDSSHLQALLHGSLRHLAASEAAWLLINLEDLWGEPEPQNVPGTSWERPNWLRKAAYSLDNFTALPQVLKVLKEIRRRRP
ncbi:MAG: 4-alpha-glucanotransferase [Deltaproteobacteria bacterium]|nr:4-alpha-glucanotransferase [Deltaproteobacteria bacterium]